MGELPRVFQVFDRVRPFEIVSGTTGTAPVDGGYVVYHRRQRVPIVDVHFDRRLADIVFDTLTMYKF